jgi:hypothetical protein
MMEPIFPSSESHTTDPTDRNTRNSGPTPGTLTSTPPPRPRLAFREGDEPAPGILEEARLEEHDIAQLIAHPGPEGLEPGRCGRHPRRRCRRRRRHRRRSRLLGHRDLVPAVQKRGQAAAARVWFGLLARARGGRGTRGCRGRGSMERQGCSVRGRVVGSSSAVLGWVGHGERVGRLGSGAVRGGGGVLLRGGVVAVGGAGLALLGVVGRAEGREAHGRGDFWVDGRIRVHGEGS